MTSSSSIALSRTKSSLASIDSVANDLVLLVVAGRMVFSTCISLIAVHDLVLVR